MKRYKVLKEFVSKKGGIMKVGNEYRVEYTGSFSDALKDNGFIEEIPEESKTVWDLKEGDECWTRTSTCSVLTGRSPVRPEREIWDGNPQQFSLRAIGGLFLTEAECDKSIRRDRAEQILLRDTKGFKPDWADGDPKYDVYYDYDENTLCIGCYCYCCGHKDLWFATKEDAEASIKTHPNEWKTYLGVEE